MPQSDAPDSIAVPPDAARAFRRMSRVILPLCGPLIFLLSSCGRGAGAPAADALIAEARKKLAPDHRTLVFNVGGTLSSGTLTVKGEIHNASLKEELLRFLRDHGGYAVVDSLIVLPESGLGPRTLGVVSLSVANIRTAPDHAAEMASQAILGTPVKILKSRGGWLYVQTPDEYLGWTDDNIVRMDAESYRDWSGRPRLIVTTPYGWVRESDDDNAQPVSDVVAGSILAMRGRRHMHYEVEYPDGRRGYLPVRDASALDAWLANTRDTPGSIVASAKRFMGVPYLWGGTSAKGMDCSGFTKTVYYLNGVLLPRDANQQATVGEPVETPNGSVDFRAGDLLFFGTKAAGEKPERVTHVAIALGGRRFIHSSGEVCMNSLDPADADFSNFRSDSFLRARRIIGSGETSGVRRLLNVPYYRTNEP